MRVKNKPRSAAASMRPSSERTWLDIELCYLCDIRPQTWIGAFFPPTWWPGPPPAPGKKRVFLYGVCQHCWQRWPQPQLARLVEEKLLQSLPTEGLQY
jgi:hypothetical protein